MSTSIACIIYDESKKKILIALRNPTGDMGNRWEFPGGKVDAGEKDCEAIADLEEIKDSDVKEYVDSAYQCYFKR